MSTPSLNTKNKVTPVSRERIKPSELFEGPNSSLKRAFDEATSNVLKDEEFTPSLNTFLEEKRRELDNYLMTKCSWSHYEDGQWFDAKFENCNFLHDMIWSFISASISEAYQQGFNEALEEIKKTIEPMKVGESEGWDFFFGNDPQCCPGDDFADIFNLALKRVRQKINSLKNK